MLNTLLRVLKRNCYVSGTFLTSKEISSTLLAVSFSLNISPSTVFCHFNSQNSSTVCSFLQFTPYIHQAHLISLFITTRNVTCTFHAVLWPSKHQSYLFSFFQTSIYVRRYLLCCLLACKHVISAVYTGASSDCFSDTYLVTLLNQKTWLVVSFWLSHYCWSFLYLILRF